MLRQAQEDLRAGHKVLNPAERQYVKGLYNGEIAYADELLGEVTRVATRTAGDRETIVCVMADHGEEFWDHGDIYHGQSLYALRPAGFRDLVVPDAIGKFLHFLG